MMTEVERANQKAQAAFHRALVTYEQTGIWEQPAEDAYLNAEADVRWEEKKAELDAQIAADHEMHDLLDLSCEECMTGYGEDVPAEWTTGEYTFGWGK